MSPQASQRQYVVAVIVFSTVTMFVARQNGQASGRFPGSELVTGFTVRYSLKTLEATSCSALIADPDHRVWPRQRRTRRTTSTGRRGSSRSREANEPSSAADTSDRAGWKDWTWRTSRVRAFSGGAARQTRGRRAVAREKADDESSTTGVRLCKVNDTRLVLASDLRPRRLTVYCGLAAQNTSYLSCPLF